MAPRTLFRKIWGAHAVTLLNDDRVLLFVTYHLINEVRSPQGFEGLRRAGRFVRRPEATLFVADHNVSTWDRTSGLAAIGDAPSREQIEALERTVRDRSDRQPALDSADHAGGSGRDGDLTGVDGWRTCVNPAGLKDHRPVRQRGTIGSRTSSGGRD